MTTAERFTFAGFETTASGRIVAACTCGWRSAACSSAAEAGALADEHRGGLDDHTSPGR